MMLRGLLNTKQPEIAARLLAVLKEWTAAIDAPVPERSNPVFDPHKQGKLECLAMHFHSSYCFGLQLHRL